MTVKKQQISKSIIHFFYKMQTSVQVRDKFCYPYKLQKQESG